MTTLVGTQLSVSVVKGQVTQPAYQSLIPLALDFTGANADYLIDPTQQYSNGLFDCIRSLYMDNSANPNPVLVTVGVTGQTFQCPPYSVGSYPVAANGGSTIEFKSVGGAASVAKAQLYNYVIPANIMIINPAGAGMAITAADGAIATLGTEADASKTNTALTGTVIAWLKGIIDTLKTTLIVASAKVTPIALTLNSIAVGGTAVIAYTVPAGGRSGGFITNGSTTDAQGGIAATENLYIDLVGTPASTDIAAAGTTTSIIPPGGSFTFPSLAAGVLIKVNAATASHAFNGEIW